MKNALAVLFSLVTLSFGMPAMSAPTAPSASERFYGKIVSLDVANNNLTVHNKRQDLDATFHWDGETAMVFNKKDIKASELKVGQFLVISYAMENNKYKAKRISVRTPFKKATP